MCNKFQVSVLVVQLFFIVLLIKGTFGLSAKGKGDLLKPVPSEYLIYYF
jgi:hypothetical protein